MISDAYNEVIRIVIAPFKVEVQFAAGSPATISWNTVVGKKYQLQYHYAFGPTAWVDLDDPVTATNLSTRLTDPIGNPEAQRFYRVKLRLN
jgi:hypothetical protein